MIRLSTLWLAVVFCTPLAHAGRIEFALTKSGERMAEGSVCLFPAEQNDLFFLKYFSSDDVRCLPADKVLEIPSGFWNSYGMFQGDGQTWISSDPAFFETNLPEGEGYLLLDVPMFPGAHLDFSTLSPPGEGEWFAVYIPNAGRKDMPAFARPVPRGREEILVPAEVPVVPLVVSRGRILRAGDPLTLKAGERRAVPPFRIEDGKGDVVVVLRQDPPRLYEMSPEPPEIVLQTEDGIVFRPVLQIRATDEFDRTAHFFRGVEPGAARIVVEGDGWKRDSVDVLVGRGRMTTAPRFLTAKATSSLEVEWTRKGSVSLTEDGTPCSTHPWIVDEAAAVLYRCDSKPKDPRIFEYRSCERVRNEPFDVEATEGSLRFDDLTPGWHVLELGFPGSTPLQEVLEIRPLEPRKLSLKYEPHEVRGRITRGGEPLEARVFFRHGAASSSAETGEYVATMRDPHGQGPVYVYPCDRTRRYEHHLDAPLALHERLDIEVPQNMIRATVRNARTKRPIPGIEVRVMPFVLEDGERRGWWGVDYRPTNEEGKATLTVLPSHLPVEVCARSERYQPACSGRFMLGATEEREFEFELEEKTFETGLLRGAGNLGEAFVYEVSPDGGRHRHWYVPPGDNGEFSFEPLGVPGSYWVLIARDHPLTVLALVSSDPLILDIPALPAWSFTIGFAAGVERSHYSLWIDGVYIPYDAVLSHLGMFRQISPWLEPGGRALVRDIAARQSVQVIRIPYFPPPELPSDIQHHDLPQYRDVWPRKSVTPGGIVIFGPED